MRIKNEIILGMGIGFLMASLLSIILYQPNLDTTNQLNVDKIQEYSKNNGYVFIKEDEYNIKIEQIKNEITEKLIKEYSSKVNIFITKGMSADQIANYLFQAELIKNELDFLEYLRNNNLENKIKFGFYILDRKMNMSEIIKIITSTE